MRIVNFFAGEGTWSNAWRDRGHEVWKTDFAVFEGIDTVEDIMNLGLRDIPEADVVLASPDCTAFSVASLGTHWGGGRRAYEPRTPKAHNRMALVHQTVAFIEAMVARDGVRYGVIENPRGMLRKLQILDRYDRETVTYCRYGDTRMKPTDLWGVPAFPPGWKPREMCQNGNPDHEAAPRGAKTGTQGLTKQARSHMPYDLALDICIAAEKELGGPIWEAGYAAQPVSPEGFVYYRNLVRPSRQHFMTPYTPDEIREVGTPYLLTGYGRSAAGFLLKHDGEIANLFNADLNHGIGEALLKQAISLGGNRAEFFAHPKLLNLYTDHGFRVVDRIPFSLDVMHKDFPDYDPAVSGTPEYLIARRP